MRDPLRDARRNGRIDELFASQFGKCCVGHEEYMTQLIEKTERARETGTERQRGRERGRERGRGLERRLR